MIDNLSFKTAVGLNSCPDGAQIRRKVFMEEQGFKNEFDDIDEKAVHTVVYADEKPAATARLFEDEKGWHIGRVACLKEFRGKGFGAAVMGELERYAAGHNIREISLSAQTAAEKFYKKLGYTSLGDLHYDEHCPHVTMVKTIGCRDC